MITIGRYRLEGPVYNKAALKDAAGVYAILDDRGSQGSFVLDVGGSERVRSRVENHDREPCWLRNHQGRIRYAALYVPSSTESQGRVIEEEIRRQFSPTCGSAHVVRPSRGTLRQSTGGLLAVRRDE